MATSTLSPSPVPVNVPSPFSPAVPSDPKKAILAQLLAGSITQEAALAALAALETKSARAPGALYCKVTQSGCISLYGLTSRFPTSLYITQWERLLDYADQIRAFIAENEGKPYPGDIPDREQLQCCS